jgi:hypothetical protein
MKLPKLLRGLLGSVLPKAMIKATPTDTQKLVTVLLTLPIAGATRDNILSLANDSHSGQQKFDIVLGHALPALVELIAGKGMDVPMSDVEDIAREFVQAVYNKVASPRATLVARVVLALFNAL